MGLWWDLVKICGKGNIILFYWKFNIFLYRQKNFENWLIFDEVTDINWCWSTSYLTRCSILISMVFKGLESS